MLANYFHLFTVLYKKQTFIYFELSSVLDASQPSDPSLGRRPAGVGAEGTEHDG